LQWLQQQDRTISTAGTCRNNSSSSVKSALVAAAG
jgi:hypothetical protein